VGYWSDDDGPPPAPEQDPTLWEAIAFLALLAALLWVLSTGVINCPR
jgi:hypothetical protein